MNLILYIHWRLRKGLKVPENWKVSARVKTSTQNPTPVQIKPFLQFALDDKFIRCRRWKRIIVLTILYPDYNAVFARTAIFSLLFFFFYTLPQFWPFCIHLLYCFKICCHRNISKVLITCPLTRRMIVEHVSFFRIHFMLPPQVTERQYIALTYNFRIGEVHNLRFQTRMI